MTKVLLNVSNHGTRREAAPRLAHVTRHVEAHEGSDGAFVIRPIRRAMMACTVAAAAAALAFVAHSAARPSNESVRGELVRANRFADSLERALSVLPDREIRAADALAALYLERQRLGIGSPFRLIDQALRDPMVDPGSRRRLASALLERTRLGLGYRVDPTALDLITTATWRTRSTEGPPAGAQHLALIASEVQRERDPRVGELTVRLAYRLAGALGSVSREAADLATGAAAQMRDRVLAIRDAARLIDAASEEASDPFALLREWRSGLLVSVERPVLQPLPPAAEREAAQRVTALVSRIEALASADEDSADSDPATRAIVSAAPRLPAVGQGLARRLAVVAQSRQLPPQGPVTVTLGSFAPLLKSTGPRDHAIRQRFSQLARNEETLAAEYALLRSHGANSAFEGAVVLAASVGLRPYGQEHAWLGADAAPSVREIQSRFGVTLSFDEEVPVPWRGYLRHVLAGALDDFLRVFPAYETRGLHVHFGDSPLHERALALHDPVTRTVFFPVGSSAGVMAHEFAHDLDWLAARRYYGSAVGYRTDRAVRHVTDQLASALRQMAGALRPDTSRAPKDPLTRPTEVFARNVDWFVTAVLAHGGRMNGYLSAVQDPILIGYGSAITPEVTWEGGGATLRALVGMTEIPPDVRSWFAETYGAERRFSVQEGVRRVLETPISPVDLRHPSRNSMDVLEASSALFRNSGANSGAWACLLDQMAEGSTDASAARAMMQYAAEARARGVVRRWRALLRHYAPVGVSAWWMLDGAPWEPSLSESVVRDVRDAILWRVVGDATVGATTGFVAARGDAGAGCSR